jgi:guanylate kinase
MVVSAPSGAGKSSIINRVLETETELGFSVSCTTRSPRTGETDGVHYHFITRDEFQAKVDADEFIEHAEFSGNCYGTLRSEVEDRLRAGKDVIIEIEVQGAEQIKTAAQGGLLKESVHFLFISPPSREILETRLRGRGTDPEEAILKRLSVADHEMAQAKWYDDVIVSDTVDNAAPKFIAVLEKKRTQLRNA